MADDLHKLVLAAKIPRPFVLVGHSMGGMNAVLYADRHPSELAGLVLLDPGAMDVSEPATKLLGSEASTRAFWDRIARCETSARQQPAEAAAIEDCARRAGMTSADFSPELNAVGLRLATRPHVWAALRSERMNIDAVDGPSGADLELRAEQRSLGALPVVVITRAATRNPGVPAEVDHQVWLLQHKAHAKLAALSTRGRLIEMSDTSHYVQLDRPEDTATAILDVVEEARQR